MPHRKKAYKKVPGYDPYRVMAQANKLSCHSFLLSTMSPLTNRLQTLPPGVNLLWSGISSVMIIVAVMRSVNPPVPYFAFLVISVSVARLYRE